MLALTYAGICQLVLLQFLAQTVLPYQVLMLIWVGAERSSRRAEPFRSSSFCSPPRSPRSRSANRTPRLATSPVGSAVRRDRPRADRVRGVCAPSESPGAGAGRARRCDGGDEAGPRSAVDHRRGTAARRVTGSAGPAAGPDRHVFGADQGAILPAPATVRASSSTPHVECRLSWAATTIAGLRTDSPEGWRRHRASDLERSQASAVLQSLLASADMQSVLGLPLVLDRRLLGVLYVGTRTSRPFSEDDAALLRLVGDRVALAVDRARSSSRSDTSRRRFSGARFLSSCHRSPAWTSRFGTGGRRRDGGGGDWFDMFEPGDGRVVLAMGDVVGRGVRAAALMGKLRTSVRGLRLRRPGSGGGRRASALADGAPAPCRDGHAPIRRPRPDRASAELASAGHMPLLIRRPNGEAQFVATEVAPRWGAPFVRFQASRVDLEPGSSLVLFTDGLVEVRGTSIELRLEELRARWMPVRVTPRRSATLCSSGCLAPKSPQDDVALLVLDLSPLPAQGFTLDFPGGAGGAVIGPAVARTVVERGRHQPHGYPRDQGRPWRGVRMPSSMLYRPGDAAFQIEAVWTATCR